MAEKPKDKLSDVIPNLDFLAPPPALPADVLKKLELNSVETKAVEFVCGGSPKLLKLINQIDDNAGRAFLDAIAKTVTNAAQQKRTPEELKADLTKAIGQVMKDYPDSAKPLSEITDIIGKDGGAALKELVDKKYLTEGWQKRLFSFFDQKSELIDPSRTEHFRSNVIGACGAAAIQSIFPNGIPEDPKKALEGTLGVIEDYLKAQQKLDKWTAPPPKGQQDTHLDNPADANRAILALAAPESDQKKGIS